MGVFSDPDGVFAADVLTEIGNAVAQSMPSETAILEAIERGVVAAITAHLSTPPPPTG